MEGMPVVWMECHPDHTCGVEGRRGWGFGLAVPTEDNEAKLPSLPGKNPGLKIKDFLCSTYSSVSRTCRVLGT